MNVDTAVTWLTWLLAGVGAIGVVLLVFVRRWAGRLVVIGIAALLLVVFFAVRQQISSIAVDNPAPLCNGGVSYFGVQLTGPDVLCTKFRLP
ncbi:hypothetical protein ABIB25_001588 [Nakamurella sp. UYEF19]|uniref:hypothetical protein n=1 Tax=Nakamurella sp. UYEF19 TaxID=1756392 RepID=UPI0033964387